MDVNILNSGDLELVNGDLVFVRGLDAVRQRVLIRLRTQRGEWAYDTTSGLDYLGEVLRKDADLALIRARILALVGSTPGVLQVRFIDVTVDNATRTLRASFVYLVSPDYLTDAERSALGLEAVASEVSDSLAVDLDSGELNLILGPAGPIF
jgi:hypothetical protein